MKEHSNEHFSVDLSELLPLRKSIDTNIRNAFKHIQVTVHMVDGVIRVQFNGETLTESPGFEELWSKDFPLARRRRSPFGWINRMESQSKSNSEQSLPMRSHESLTELHTKF
jgi:hypothetical protein